MDYYPFPVLCRDTIVVSQQEGNDSCGKRVCAQNRGPARLHAGVLGKACCNKPPQVLCRDRVGSPCVATGFWAARVLV